MPHSRFLAPSPLQLRETAMQVLTRLAPPELDRPADLALDWLEVIGLGVDADAGRMASERAHDAMWGQSGSLPMMLARVAVAITFNPVLTFHSRELTRHIAAWTAAVQVGELALILGYRLDVAALRRLATMLEHAQRPGTAVPDAVTLLAGALAADANPMPRAEFLTPLTHISVAEQARLLQVAAAARAEMTRLGYRVDIPGERLGPEDNNSWPPQLMYGVERQRILGSSLVIILADAHHSYGAGQCQTWAESMGIDALVFSTHPSRALGDGYWHTKTVPFTSPDEVVATVVAHARARQAMHRRRAATLAERRRSWVDSILLPAPPILDSAVSDWLPGRRLDALASSPLELETLSVAELRALRDGDPAKAAPVLRAIGEPEPRIELGLTMMGGHTGLEAHHMYMAGPEVPADAPAVHRALSAHPMHERMNQRERDDFVALVLAAGLLEWQVDQALNEGLDRIEDTAAYHRTHPGRDFWVQVLRRVKGLS